MNVYLDHNATTPLAPEAFAAMEPFLRGEFGNPSSLHRVGTRVRPAVDAARAQAARLVGADASEILFTSGGTESNALALRGAWEGGGRRHHLITSRVEHPAVKEPFRQLQEAGASLVEIGVDASGQLDLAALAEALASGPALVSIMWANNETGVCFPLNVVARLVHASGGLLHTDAVQAAGRVPINVGAVPVDLLTLSAHKLHGPKGVGALYVRRGTTLTPQQRGGGQEHGLRGGTLNVPGIVGLGAACALANARLPEMARVAALRDRLEQGLLAACPRATVHGAHVPRLPNTLSVRFPGMAGESLLYRLDDAGIAVSTGSACSAGRQEPSHVILAMGVPGREAGNAIRFSLGHGNTETEIDFAIRQVVKSLRA